MGSAAEHDSSAMSSLPSVEQTPPVDPRGAHDSAALASTLDTARASGASASAQAVGMEATTEPVAVTGVSAQTITVSAGAGTSRLLGTGIPMQEMIDSIRATIEIAARQGIVHARIELQPEELGQISIRLSQTSEGLSARVTADTPAGAQALAQGGSELRQSLSSLGLSLLRLDIGSFNHSEARDQGARFATRTDGSGASTKTVASGEDEAVDELDGGNRPSGGAMGEIVDVLA
jgi:flagellar hook-length control protein FliK